MESYVAINIAALMLSEKLKISTKANHQHLEKILVQRLKGITLIKEYVSILHLFYSYFGALEISIEKFIDKTVLPDHPQRRKTSALAADILSFDEILPALLTDAEISQVVSHPAAMGALYVMEGSTLGGAVISKMIQDKLGMMQNGLLFFNSYGDNTMNMWLTFKRSLDETIFTEDEETIIIGSANDTFLKFGLLLQSRPGVDGQ